MAKVKQGPVTAACHGRGPDQSPDLPVGRRRSGCGACRAAGGDEHGRERTRRCV